MRFRGAVWGIAAVVLWAGGNPVAAAGPQSAERQRLQACLVQAATYHRVSPLVLDAMVQQESSWNPSAVNRNTNGSLDLGLTQDNSIHWPELRRYGIAPSHMMDGCVSLYVRAWRYRKKIDKWGDTWMAVGAVHSETPHLRARYARAVAARLGLVVR